MASITSNLSQNNHTTRCAPCLLFQHICSQIVPELFPQYEARNVDPQTCPNGDLMQMMSMKNIAFAFLFRSPDQETCPGYFTHP